MLSYMCVCVCACARVDHVQVWLLFVCTVISITLSIILGHHAMGCVVMSCVVMSCVRLGFSNDSHAANSLGSESGLTACCAWPKRGGTLWICCMIRSSPKVWHPTIYFHLGDVLVYGGRSRVTPSSFVRSHISWLFLGARPLPLHHMHICVYARVPRTIWLPSVRVYRQREREMEKERESERDSILSILLSIYISYLYTYTWILHICHTYMYCI